MYPFKKFRKIVKYFSLDLEAEKLSKLTHVSRPTINNILEKIRERMAEHYEEDPKFSDVVEVDESYFGSRRVKGKRGRGAANKVPVFGI